MSSLFTFYEKQKKIIKKGFAKQGGGMGGNIK
jgi:hypothetical protein